MRCAPQSSLPSTPPGARAHAQAAAPRISPAAIPNRPKSCTPRAPAQHGASFPVAVPHHPRPSLARPASTCMPCALRRRHHRVVGDSPRRGPMPCCLPLHHAARNLLMHRRAHRRRSPTARGRVHLDSRRARRGTTAAPSSLLCPLVSTDVEMPRRGEMMIDVELVSGPQTTALYAPPPRFPLPVVDTSAIAPDGVVIAESKSM
ncbi:hypothetical protein B0H11DRAFT_1996109, partial [Mycena galericulata]